jgi:hypothetical protein
MMKDIIRRRAGRLAATASLALLVATAAARAAEPGQSFASPDEAVAAMVAAARGDDAAGLERILGPEGRPLVESGDAVADREGRQTFVVAYDQMHRIEAEGDGKAVLVIGQDEWPMPIPLVRKDRSWHFDTAAGSREILDRRIGRNELSTVQTCRALVEAQREYAAKDRLDDGLQEYAQHFRSSAGKHDGLYWEAAAGEEESPIGELVAEARAEGYPPRAEGAPPIPYHGYFFRILTRQGPHAAGGAYDYVANGHMIGGFALIAFPATYGDSGIMTFIVNQDGKVFERNLGPETEAAARKIAAFDPDPSWKAVEK